MKKLKTILKVIFSILRWLLVLLFAGLLAAHLFLRGPWKLGVLLALLAATFAITWKIRKWILLTWAAMIIALVVWVFLPDETEGWRPYTFDEELKELEVARAIPDDLNAAVIYNELLEDYDPNDYEYNWPDDRSQMWMETMNRSWRSDEYPELAKWLQEEHSHTIQTLMQAAERKRCVFPLDINMASTHWYYERGSAMRGWGRILVLSANNDLGNGHLEKAMRKYESLFQIANHALQDVGDTGVFIGIAIDTATLRPLTHYVTKESSTATQLDSIKDILQLLPAWSDVLREHAPCERILNKNMICGTGYQVNNTGKTRFSLDPTAWIRAHFKAILGNDPLAKRLDAKQKYTQRKICKAWTIRTRLTWPNDPQTTADRVDRMYDKLLGIQDDYDFAENFYRSNSGKILSWGPEAWFYYFTVQTKDRIRTLYLRSQSHNQAMRILIELKLYKLTHGTWPESLDVISDAIPTQILVDPSNSLPYVYKLTEDGFTLYSVGHNKIDEDGQCKWRDNKDDQTFWPPRTGKKRKEAADPNE